MKKIISAAWTGSSVNWDTLSRALLQYRNTPCRKDGRSPAQKPFGNPVQDSLPAHRCSFAQECIQEAEATATQTQQAAEASILAVYLTSKLASTSQYKMLPPRCGTFMEPLQPLVLIGDILLRCKMDVFLLETDDSSTRESHYPSLAHNLHHPFQSHTQHPSQTLVGHLTSHSDPRTLSRIQLGSTAPLSM